MKATNSEKDAVKTLNNRHLSLQACLASILLY